MSSATHDVVNSSLAANIIVVHFTKYSPKVRELKESLFDQSSRLTKVSVQLEEKHSNSTGGADGMYHLQRDGAMSGGILAH